VNIKGKRDYLWRSEVSHQPTRQREQQMQRRSNAGEYLTRDTSVV